MGLVEGKVVSAPPSALDWGAREIRARRPRDLSDTPDELTIQALINSMPAAAAVVDCNWNVLQVNQAWQQAENSPSCDALLPGGNYYLFCATTARACDAPSTLLDALDDIAAGRRTRFWHTYTAPSNQRPASYRVCVSKLDLGGPAHAMITRYDTTELIRLRRQCQALGGSVLDIQDDERRRIGRELHDSTAQLLVALQLDCMRLKHGNAAPTDTDTLDEIAATIAKIHTEIRATSYLFHPPSNMEQSLPEALGGLVAGFGKRTGLKSHLTFSVRTELLPIASRTAMFRIAQEALVNVHRHASATAVEVRLNERGGYIRLIIRDNGIGVPEHFHRPLSSRVALGVGISGMKERLSQLGGRMVFRRVERGTCLIASLPIA